MCLTYTSLRVMVFYPFHLLFCCLLLLDTQLFTSTVYSLKNSYRSSGSESETTSSTNRGRSGKVISSFNSNGSTKQQRNDVPVATNSIVGGVDHVVYGVRGGSVHLPCNVAASPPVAEASGSSGVIDMNDLDANDVSGGSERPRLVLWWRNATVIYTYDLRDEKSEQARHWSHDQILRGRAFFTISRLSQHDQHGGSDGAYLNLENLTESDESVYECRVDFRKSRSRTSKIKLNVIVPPEKPRIFAVQPSSERQAYRTRDGYIQPSIAFMSTEKQIDLKLGPYTIGSSLELRCESYGGKPSPRLTWWRDHSLIDDSYNLDSNLATKKSVQVVENTLKIENLERSDLHTLFTCQASNSNLSIPLSTSVKLDMHFSPLSVEITNVDDIQPLSASKEYFFKCRSVGSRPEPQITWWLNGIQLDDKLTNQQSSPDGNITISTLPFTPSKFIAASTTPFGGHDDDDLLISDSSQQNQNLLTCKANNHLLPNDKSVLTSVKLRIYHVPEARLNLGSQMNSSTIKEGDDAYFECKVISYPPPYKISWRHNGRELTHNPLRHTIIANQSLVLQRLSRVDSGVYTCVAHNLEGDGISNAFNLNVKHRPVCKGNQVQVYGVALFEQIQVACEVLANPSVGLKFYWTFESTHKKFKLGHELTDSKGTTSMAFHTPMSNQDYGTLECHASNSIGDGEPCSYKVILAGPPKPVSNCHVANHSISTVHVTCDAGFDGGLPQVFVMEVRDANLPEFTVSNTTNTHDAVFTVTGLRSSTAYLIDIYAVNSKGRSETFQIQTFTQSEFNSDYNHLSKEMRTAAGHELHAKTPVPSWKSALRVGSLKLSILQATLLCVGSALILVLLVLSFAICIKTERARCSAAARNARGGESSRGSLFFRGDGDGGDDSLTGLTCPHSMLKMKIPSSSSSSDMLYNPASRKGGIHHSMGGGTINGRNRFLGGGCGRGSSSSSTSSDTTDEKFCLQQQQMKHHHQDSSITSTSCSSSATTNRDHDDAGQDPHDDDEREPLAPRGDKGGVMMGDEVFYPLGMKELQQNTTKNTSIIRPSCKKLDYLYDFDEMNYQQHRTLLSHRNNNSSPFSTLQYSKVPTSMNGGNMSSVSGNSTFAKSRMNAYIKDKKDFIDDTNFHSHNVPSISQNLSKPYESPKHPQKHLMFPIFHKNSSSFLCSDHASIAEKCPPSVGDQQQRHTNLNSDLEEDHPLSFHGKEGAVDDEMSLTRMRKDSYLEMVDSAQIQLDKLLRLENINNQDVELKICSDDEGFSPSSGGSGEDSLDNNSSSTAGSVTIHQSELPLVSNTSSDVSSPKTKSNRNTMDVECSSSSSSSAEFSDDKIISDTQKFVMSVDRKGSASLLQTEFLLMDANSNADSPQEIQLLAKESHV